MQALLSGMRVVEGSAFIAAPSGGMTLAQLGADVIRFDQIGGGIDYRRWPVTDKGKSLYWHSLNKGKRSFAVDFRKPEGKELITRLICADGEDAGSVFWSHYTDEKNSPLYSFGFGLSYTSFKYSKIELSKNVLMSAKKDNLTASIKLTNTGDVKGKEVVQLYLHDRFASATRPVKELKGFEMVELDPGESKKVNFIITEKMLEFYSAKNIWESELGIFDIYIGTDSNTKRKASFKLN